MNIQNKILLHFIFFPFFILLSVQSFSQFIPGNTYYDPTGFVEYRTGNLPIIISAPHGGSLEPDSIPDRDCAGCVTVKDSWTQTIAEGMHEANFEQTGCYPHVIINLLHRKKFDANRAIGDAANGNPTVEQAFNGYHAFIDAAKNQVVEDFGRGLFLDIHGHGHPIQRIELGYLLSGAELRLSDTGLNTNDFIEESSIRTLVGDNIQSHTHAELLRGEDSFGELMENKGFSSVPSFSDPFPQIGDDYFSGGYNTQRHGSRDNEGQIDAIQVELNQDIRFDESTRAMLIDSLVHAANLYIDAHFNDQYLGNFCNLITSTSATQSQFKIDLFPNPATNYLEIKSELKNIEISIYNLVGQKIMEEIWSGNRIEIASLKNGYYIIQMKKGSSNLGSRKLIKY